MYIDVREDMRVYCVLRGYCVHSDVGEDMRVYCVLRGYCVQ